MTSPHPGLLINNDAAPKTGAHSDGAILYRLLTDEKRTDVFIAITGNQGGTGYFSKEAVPFSKIMQCVADLPRDRPVPSKRFQSAFEGRSANNAGFLAAILRHLALLTPAIDLAHQHLLAGDWESWRLERLSDPVEPLPHAEPQAAPAGDRREQAGVALDASSGPLSQAPDERLGRKPKGKTVPKPSSDLGRPDAEAA